MALENDSCWALYKPSTICASTKHKYTYELQITQGDYLTFKINLGNLTKVWGHLIFFARKTGDNFLSSPVILTCPWRQHGGSMEAAWRQHGGSMEAAWLSG